MPVGTDEWTAVRASVGQTTDRLADLVSSATKPTARATGHWSIVQATAHVATVAALHNATLRPASPSIAIPDLAELLGTITVDTVSTLNDLALEHITDSDPHVIADRLRAEVSELLRVTADHDPADEIDWLGGSHVPVAGIVAHMLNELSIHGRDVARAVGAPWSISPSDAAAFFDMFVVGMVRSGYGRLLDVDGPPSRGRVAVQFRSRSTSIVTMVLDDGVVRVEDDPEDIDVRISYDPVTLNLMMFGRVSKARAMLTGKVVVGGPRPWLLPKFFQTVRMPG